MLLFTKNGAQLDRQGMELLEQKTETTFLRHKQGKPRPKGEVESLVGWRYQVSEGAST